MENLVKKLLLGVGLIGALAGCVPTEQTPRPELVGTQRVQLSTSQSASIQSQVKDRLIDPGSATFRNIRAQDRSFSDGTKSRVICGEVNSRNRMGGYAGFSTFSVIMEAGKVKTLHIDGGPGALSNLSSMACSNL